MNELQTWITESIDLAEEELGNSSDPNSYGNGYEAGSLHILHEIQSKLAIWPTEPMCRKGINYLQYAIERDIGKHHKLQNGTACQMFKTMMS